ncbi:MAG: putative transposase, partial [Paracoccaceae bacterium]
MLHGELVLLFPRHTKWCLKRNTAKVMVFKLIKEAEKRWLRLRGKNQLPKVIQGI